jgi:hypothetical protein
MYACGPCHEKRSCPAGRHEFFYWEKCEFCGGEAQCVDCVPGQDARPTPRLSAGTKQAYLNVAPLRYRRKRAP